MRSRVLVLLALGVCCAGNVGIRRTPIGQGGNSPYRLRYDQVGYPLDGERFAVVLSPGKQPPRYRIYDSATQRLVGDGTAGPRVLDTTSRAGTPLTGDRIDFTTLMGGSYFVVLDDDSRAGPIVIGKNVYDGILPLIVRFLAEQRCGPTTKSVSLHDECHLFRSIRNAHSGDGMAVDDGARPPYAASNPVDVEGGWHDAGDYIKFVGTTAYVLAVDLMALRDHRTALGRGGDALASELRWGLDWLLKMVAGAEPYHQVGGEGDHDPDWRVPEGDTKVAIPAYDQRPAFRMAKGHGRNLLGRCAAAFALGSKVYADDPAYAGKLLLAAKATYALARARTAVQNPDPPQFYKEDSGADDLVLGAATLARAGGDATYATDAYKLSAMLTASPGTWVGWNSVDALALSEAASLFAVGSKERTDLAHRLDGLAAPIAATSRSPVGPGAAFGYALPAFGNGSIAESLGAAVTCLAARRLNKTAGCDVVARRQLHWLLGENPFGLTFLVGAGTVSPENIHHSFARAAHVRIPGAIPGGPTALSILIESKLPAPPRDDPFATWSTDALLYEDKAEDYVCNEPAIDFTAALVFILADLAELDGGG
jgi:endoglucanase